MIRLYRILYQKESTPGWVLGWTLASRSNFQRSISLQWHTGTAWQPAGKKIERSPVPNRILCRRDLLTMTTCTTCVVDWPTNNKSDSLCSLASYKALNTLLLRPWPKADDHLHSEPWLPKAADLGRYRWYPTCCLHRRTTLADQISHSYFRFQLVHPGSIPSPLIV